MTDVGEVKTRFFEFASADRPFELASGATLPRVRLAYETYGRLSQNADNAILLFHALTGSQHAAGINQGVEGVPLWNDECTQGWWDPFIGPGKVLDTEK